MVLCYFTDSPALLFSVNQKLPLFFIHFYYLSYVREVAGKPFSVILILWRRGYYSEPSKGPCQQKSVFTSCKHRATISVRDEKDFRFPSRGERERLYLNA